MDILQTGEDKYARGKLVYYPYYRDCFIEVGDVCQDKNTHRDSKFATAIRKVQNANPNRER